jgi:uncharacterized protein (DUF2126 family)
MSAYSPEQWRVIDALGQQVDQDLEALGVGLTMGGEPTYVSATDFESLQWRYQALGDDKRRLGKQLLQRLQHDLAPQGALLHDGVGKLYPGEPFPRWALGCFWREDGQPLWQDPEWLWTRPSSQPRWATTTAFVENLTESLGLPQNMAIVAHDAAGQHAVGYVLPVLPITTPEGSVWASCSWKFATESQLLQLVPGHTPAGMRLPLQALQATPELATEAQGTLQDPPVKSAQGQNILPANSIQVALCIERRDGHLHIFMPPLFAVRGYVDLLSAVDQVASSLQQPVVIEGYRPPLNQGIQGFQITPDPGVLEVNIHPAGSWAELVQLHNTLDQAAADCGLATFRYGRDGYPVDTGGGAHLTLGARYPDHSPLIRRPDLLASLVTYWQHHPSLSYLFAGQFVGPTSQSPRVDEASPDSLEQLEMAFALLDPGAPLPPTVVDHLLHHLLVDITGNTHRAAFCIDKLFPGNNPPQQLGLLELRGFAMPPDGQMRLLQMLLVRACVAWFWQMPYRHTFKQWGADLHDRFLLPYFIETDLAAVLEELRQAGYHFSLDWFQPFFEFRCPIYAQVPLPGLNLEIRHALEPWPVLANETTASGSSRPVDDSTERLQVMIQQEEMGQSLDSPIPSILLCNGRRVPLQVTHHPGQFVAGIRYRARSYTWNQIAEALAKSPLTLQQKLANFWQPQETLKFEVFSTRTGKPLGGCSYQVQGAGLKSEPPIEPVSPSYLQPLPKQRIKPLAGSDCTHPLPESSLRHSFGVTIDLRDPRQK